MLNEHYYHLQADQEQKVLVEKQLLEHYFDEAVLDILTITENQFFISFLSGEDHDLDHQKATEDLVVDLFRFKKNYYQLRHLDNNGMEVFRVERRHSDPYICKANELQDKSSRYYFQQSIQLNSGQFYVSPFDLNIEYGKIEIPYRPMLRICIPVFNSKQEKLGVNVLTFDGRQVIEELDAESAKEEGVSYLVNNDGYILNTQDSTLEWSFMFPDQISQKIQQLFPESYTQLLETDWGQFKNAKGLFTVADVFPFKGVTLPGYNLNSAENYRWKIISLLPSEKLGFGNFVSISNLILWYGIVLLSGLWLAYFYADATLRRFLAQSELVESERKLTVANQAKDQFFSIVSHDLKNGSGTIANYLEFMQESYVEFGEEERQMHLKDVTFAAAQHNKLLYEILDWARLQQGRVEFKPLVISLNELLEEQVNMVGLQLKNKGLTISCDLDADLQVLGDREMLKAILRNLISNAIKFSFRDNRILISAKQKDGEVEVKVVDFGIGMRKTDATKIFDLSSKIQQPGTEKESGTGFGLKLVAEMVEKNSGTIRVESELEKGTSFIISLVSEK
ncbi:sensor histidine kinase [Sunxiuqinia sp. sy24]|uniref:sensor histidine kinase n=1 Tax=Sunxiuqinia sp. sy24 TaxID=3461495 RepID=UPI0040466FA9